MFGKVGDQNPFYGKNHGQETKDNLSKKRYKLLDNMSVSDKISLDLQLAEARKVHANNPTRSNYDIWVEKYGISEAENRLQSFKEKLSLRFSGSGNPMFGRSPGSGSGAGWGGWLDGKYFRSLRELSFMLKNPNAISAETKEWRARYTDSRGSDRTTVADFVLHDVKLLVECKPLALHKTVDVVRKAEALQGLAESLGYRFTLVDPEILLGSELTSLVSAGRVKFNKSTIERFEKWQSSNKKC